MTGFSSGFSNAGFNRSGGGGYNQNRWGNNSRDNNNSNNRGSYNRAPQQQPPPQQPPPPQPPPQQPPPPPSYSPARNPPGAGSYSKNSSIPGSIASTSTPTVSSYSPPQVRGDGTRKSPAPASARVCSHLRLCPSFSQTVLLTRMLPATCGSLQQVHFSWHSHWFTESPGGHLVGVARCPGWNGLIPLSSRCGSRP